LTSFIEKRRSLHRTLDKQIQENDQLRFQITRLQPLATLGVNTAMIAHEINNLLTPIGTYAQLAMQNSDDTALKEKAIEKARRNTQKACQLMESLLATTKGTEQQKQQTNLKEILEEVFTCLARDFSKDRITVKTDIPADLTVPAVPVQIQQVFMNLVLNARKAMLDKGGTLTIKAWPDEQDARIRVSDTGAGIESDDLKKIFQPFFSTVDSRADEDAQSGSGLGLVFCKQVIEEHDGSISVESIPGHGTTFTITLPRQSDEKFED
jgi:signal transduction histidine kinase